jgi:hypothetical protein
MYWNTAIMPWDQHNRQTAHQGEHSPSNACVLYLSNIYPRHTPFDEKASPNLGFLDVQNNSLFPQPIPAIH